VLSNYFLFHIHKTVMVWKSDQLKCWCRADFDL